MLRMLVMFLGWIVAVPMAVLIYLVVSGPVDMSLPANLSFVIEEAIQSEFFLIGTAFGIGAGMWLFHQKWIYALNILAGMAAATALLLWLDIDMLTEGPLPAVFVITFGLSVGIALLGMLPHKPNPITA